MKDYSLFTKKGWLETKMELEKEFKMWGVTDWVVSPANQKSVMIRYIYRGREIVLTMDKQNRPQDNLRVLYFAIHSMRLNELRGIGSVLESAYLQLAAPSIEKDPFDVLGLPRGTALSVCEAQFKELAKQYHPDNAMTGSTAKFQEISSAIEEIRTRSK